MGSQFYDKTEFELAQSIQFGESQNYCETLGNPRLKILYQSMLLMCTSNYIRSFL